MYKKIIFILLGNVVTVSLEPLANISLNFLNLQNCIIEIQITVDLGYSYIQGVSKKRGIKELNIKTMKRAFQEKH